MSVLMIVLKTIAFIIIALYFFNMGYVNGRKNILLQLKNDNKIDKDTHIDYDSRDTYNN